MLIDTKFDIGEEAYRINSEREIEKVIIKEMRIYATRNQFCVIKTEEMYYFHSKKLLVADSKENLFRSMQELCDHWNKKLGEKK